MSFKEILAALRAQEQREYVEGQREKEAERERLTNEEEWNRVRTQRLAERTRRFTPIFDSVNQIYLQGEGKVSLEKQPSLATLRLEWGQYRDDNGVHWSYGGQRLELTLDDDSRVTIRGEGRNSPCVHLSLQDEDLESKVESGILSILTTPRACFYSSSGNHFDP